MRNDDLALCLWAHDVWGGISRKPLEIETGVQRTTNRKWTIANPMVTWPMTSHEPERSRSWPLYVWCQISRKRLEIATWWQWSAYRKWSHGNRMVTWPMTSHDPERSRSWPQYVWCPISRKWLQIATWVQWTTNRSPMGFEWSRDWWRHVTQKGQCHDPNIFGTQYLDSGWRYGLGTNGVSIGNDYLRFEWSRDR